MVVSLFTLARNPRLQLGAACLLVALVGFLTYQRDLGDLFTASDTLPLIESARITAPEDLGRILGERLMAGTSFPGRFFRPLSVLTFSLDYRLWGLEPFGYHLLNLLLHAAAAVLVFLLARALTGGRLGAALLAGVVFATHPVLVETVPAIARRMDILEFLFCGLAYLLFLGNAARPAPTRGRLWASAGCCFLALCAKETAVYLPGLIAAHVYVFGEAEGRSRRQRVGRALRAVLPYLAPLAVFAVWRTLVLHGPGTDAFENSFSRIVLSYLAGLSYPQDILRLGAAASPAVRLLVALGGGALLWLLFRGSRLDPVTRRTARLALLWLALPLGILLMAHCFDYRNLYTSAAPFSILAAVVLSGTLAGVVRRFGSGPAACRSPVCRLAMAAAACCLLVSLEASSPLLRRYPGWGDSGRVQAAILERLSGAVAGLPDDARLRVSGLPRELATPVRGRPAVRSLSYLREYTIESWLQLQRPGSRMTVEVERWERWPGLPRSLEVAAVAGPGREVAVAVTSTF